MLDLRFALPGPPPGSGCPASPPARPLGPPSRLGRPFVANTPFVTTMAFARFMPTVFMFMQRFTIKWCTGCRLQSSDCKSTHAIPRSPIPWSTRLTSFVAVVGICWPNSFQTQNLSSWHSKPVRGTRGSRPGRRRRKRRPRTGDGVEAEVEDEVGVEAKVYGVRSRRCRSRRRSGAVEAGAIDSKCVIA